MKLLLRIISSLNPRGLTSLHSACHVPLYPLLFHSNRQMKEITVKLSGTPSLSTLSTLLASTILYHRNSFIRIFSLYPLYCSSFFFHSLLSFYTYKYVFHVVTQLSRTFFTILTALINFSDAYTVEWVFAKRYKKCKNHSTQGMVGALTKYKGWSKCESPSVPRFLIQ